MEFCWVDAAGDDALWCLRQYFAELDHRFPEGFHPGPIDADTVAGLAPPSGGFLVVYDDAGQPVGCGGLQQIDATVGEVKRMWVAASARGQGLATQILTRLEQTAIRAGYDTIRLDTHGVLAEAHALYRGNGYVEIERYNDNPDAQMFFEKVLAPPTH